MQRCKRYGSPFLFTYKNSDPLVTKFMKVEAAQRKTVDVIVVLKPRGRKPDKEKETFVKGSAL